MTFEEPNGRGQVGLGQLPIRRSTEIRSRPLQKVDEWLKDGENFDAVFTEVYGGTPENFSKAIKADKYLANGQDCRAESDRD